MESYRKNSNAFLELDAHFTVVEAALKGYIRWVESVIANPSTAQPNVSFLPGRTPTSVEFCFFELTTVCSPVTACQQSRRARTAPRDMV